MLLDSPPAHVAGARGACDPGPPAHQQRAQRTACNAQQVRHTMQRAAHSVQRCKSLQRAARDVQHATRDARRVTRDARRATRDMQHSTCHTQQPWLQRPRRGCAARPLCRRIAAARSTAYARTRRRSHAQVRSAMRPAALIAFMKLGLPGILSMSEWCCLPFRLPFHLPFHLRVCAGTHPLGTHTLTHTHTHTHAHAHTHTHIHTYTRARAGTPSLARTPYQACCVCGNFQRLCGNF
jgi:hypothetical protein